jgi:hypothetical protein
VARSKEECARLVVSTLNTELGELVQSCFGVSADPHKPESKESLARLIQDALSGKTRAAESFIDAGVCVEFSTAWQDKLLKAGVTRDELEKAHFVTKVYNSYEFQASTVVAANGRFRESALE